MARLSKLRDGQLRTEPGEHGRQDEDRTGRVPGQQESGNPDTNQRMSQYRTGGPGCREERGVVA